MKNCGHIVSYQKSAYDNDNWLDWAGDVDFKWGNMGDGQRFNFCPNCGASLASFWQSVDASREAFRQEQERESAKKSAEAKLEAIYSNTPPT